MTDEEFANMSDADFAEYEAEHQDDEVEMETADEEDEAPEVEANEGSMDPELEDDEVAIKEPEDLEDTDPIEEVENGSEPEEDTPEPLKDETESDEENTLTSETDTFDYKANFDALMAPLKANGQEVQVKSAEDARRLIQMGLNYDDKLVAIKPARLAGKALERAGIIKDGVVNEDALNRMIDFNNGNIEVMKARLKELKIDPLDLDLDDTDYQAQDHMVSEHSIEIDDIQNQLNTRGSTEQVVGALNQLDEGSRDFFSENPQQLLGLEQDVTSGVFDEIYGNVQYERRMGRLAGKTDMEAYIDFAQARGQAMRDQEPEVQKPTKTVNAKKRAKAAGSKPAPAKTTEAVNPFDMTDDEFEKQFGGAQAIR